MSALYGPLVAAHVVLVVAGTVGLGVTAGYLVAARVRPTAEPVLRFFRGGIGVAPRLLYPAALAGLLASAGSRGRVRLDAGWVWGAGALWLGAALLVETAVRRAAGSVTGTAAVAPGAVRAAWAAVALAVAASALMVVQP